MFRTSKLFAGLCLSLACLASQAFAQVSTGPTAPAKQPAPAGQVDIGKLPLNPQNLMAYLQRIDPKATVSQGKQGQLFYWLSVQQNGRTYRVGVTLNTQAQTILLYTTVARLPQGQMPAAGKLATLLQVHEMTHPTYFSLRGDNQGNTYLDANQMTDSGISVGRFAQNLGQFLQNLNRTAGVWTTLSV